MRFGETPIDEATGAILAHSWRANGVNFSKGRVLSGDDVAKLNASLQQELAAKGLAFNKLDAAAFRDKLRTAGFYTEWKGKYGEEAWSILEKSVGKLT